MRLPQDRILHIDTELAGDEVRVVAEWQGELVRCKDCKWYQGVHGVQGHAPCEWFNKQVLWNDFCSNGEPYKGGEDE